jgi:hypothetical protein
MEEEVAAESRKGERAERQQRVGDAHLNEFSKERPVQSIGAVDAVFSNLPAHIDFDCGGHS